MAIKLIASDMDGTLLNSRGVVTQKSQQTIARAMQAGVSFVPATGRVYSALPPAIKTMQGVDYIITSNGAAVYRRGEEKPIYENLMSSEKVIRLLQCLEPFDCLKELYVKGNGYFEKGFLQRLDALPIYPPAMKELYYGAKQPVEDIRVFARSCTQGIEKINIPWLQQSMRTAIFEMLAAEFDDIYVTTSLATNVEVSNIHVNKGDGLRALCGVLGLTPKEVMACGDGENDREMLTAAGTAVVMGNASNELKTLASFVTTTNDEDGVAHAIETLVLKELH